MIISNKPVFARRPTKLSKEKEYRIRELDSNKYPNIVGKVGTIVKWAGYNQCYFKIGNDVYLLPFEEIDPRPVTGLFNVDYRKIISSKLFEGVSVGCGRETTQDISKFLSKAGLCFAYSHEAVVPYLEIEYKGITLHIGFVSYLTSQGSGIVIGGDPDHSSLSDQFEYITGKNVWAILKTLSYLELPLCSCGSKHQIWKESRKYNKVILLCADCEYMIYKSYEDFQYNYESDILQVFKDNSAV